MTVSKSNSLVYLNFKFTADFEHLKIFSLVERLKGLRRPALEKDDLLQLDTPSYQWFTRKFYTVSDRFIPYVEQAAVVEGYLKVIKNEYYLYLPLIYEVKQRLKPVAKHPDWLFENT